MFPNEAQGRALIARGWLPREEIVATWQELSQSASPQDLLATLEARGLLSPQQSAELRHELRPASKPSHATFGVLPEIQSGVHPSHATFGVLPSLSGEPSGLGQPGSSSVGLDSEAGLRTVASGAFAVPARSQTGHSSVPGLATSAVTSSVLPPHFELIRELGRGGMGVVNLARHRVTGAEVVIKQMLGNMDSFVAVTRFEREARALARIKHPNVVAIHELGEHAGKPYFVMDRVLGRSMKEILDEQRRRLGAPEEEWLGRTFGALARALKACHAQDILHRDLKPENIIIEDGSERPVLVDFGLVRFGDDIGTGNSLTKTGQMLGTPAYMAPEQADAKGDLGVVTPFTDVWGLGATLYDALTGSPPYQGSSAINIVKQLLAGPPPPPSKRAENVPAWLDSICVAALRHDPRHRPSCDQLIEALETREPIRTKGSLGSSPSRLGRYLAASAGFLALLMVALIARLDRVAPSLELDGPLNLRTRNRRLRIKGHIKDADPAGILLDGAPAKGLKLRADGAFSMTLLLSEPSHDFRLEAIDAAGNKGPALHLKASLDLEPPRLSIRLAEAPLEFFGTISEEGCQLELGGTPVAVKGRRFRHRIDPSKAKISRILRVVDAAGNRTKALLPIRLVDSKEKGALLPRALREAAAGSRLVLLPGTHRGGGEIVKSLEILGLPGARWSLRGDPGLLIKLKSDEQANIRGIHFLGEGRRGKGAGQGIFLKSGKLSLSDCSFARLGESLIRSGEVGIEGSSPSLLIRHCSLARDGKYGLVACSGSLRVEFCYFSEEKGLGNLGLGDKAPGMIDLTGVEANVNDCLFNRSSTSALRMTGGRLSLRRSIIRQQKLDGLSVRGRSSVLKINDCVFSESMRHAVILKQLQSARIED